MELLNIEINFGLHVANTRKTSTFHFHLRPLGTAQSSSGLQRFVNTDFLAITSENVCSILRAQTLLTKCFLRYGPGLKLTRCRYMTQSKFIRQYYIVAAYESKGDGKAACNRDRTSGFVASLLTLQERVAKTEVNVQQHEIIGQIQPPS